MIQAQERLESYSTESDAGLKLSVTRCYYSKLALRAFYGVDKPLTGFGSSTRFFYILSDAGRIDAARDEA